MGLDPAVHMAADIGLAALALAHAHVLGVDVLDGQLHHGEELGSGRIFLGPGFVGQDVLLIELEAVVLAIGQLGLVFALGTGDIGYLQPADLLARAQHGVHPERGPDVIQNGLAAFVAGDGVGNQGLVVALPVGDAGLQIQSLEMFVDGQLAAPARVAARQVGLAVAIGVEQRCQLGVLELCDAGDLVLLGRGLVDQIALYRIARIGAGAIEGLVCAIVLIKGAVQWHPVSGGKGGVALGHGHMLGAVFQTLDGLYPVAQLLQSARNQQGLEHFLIHRTLERLHRDAFAGQFARVRLRLYGSGAKAQQGDGSQTAVLVL